MRCHSAGICCLGTDAATSGGPLVGAGVLHPGWFGRLAVRDFTVHGSHSGGGTLAKKAPEPALAVPDAFDLGGAFLTVPRCGEAWCAMVVLGQRHGCLLTKALVRLTGGPLWRVRLRKVSVLYRSGLIGAVQ